MTELKGDNTKISGNESVTQLGHQMYCLVNNEVMFELNTYNLERSINTILNNNLMTLRY